MICIFIIYFLPTQILLKKNLARRIKQDAD